MNALSILNPEHINMAGKYMEMARVFYASNMLPSHIKSPEAAFFIMATALELNIPIMQGFRKIYVIQGTPTIAPELMLAMINRSGLLEDMKVEDDGRTCTVSMKRVGRSWQSFSFGVDDADKMMTTEYIDGQKKTIPLSQKFNWRTMPKIMRYHRAVSGCSRITFPDVTMGLYTVEEIATDQAVLYDEDGNITGGFEPPAALPAPVHWTQVAEQRDTWIEYLNGQGYSLDEALTALGVASLDQVMLSGKEAMQAIRAYYADHPRVIAEVDLDEAEEIPYQQTEQAAAPSELDQFLGAREEIPADHFLSNTQQRKRFFKQIDTLGYTREGIIELMAINRLHELPANYDQAVSSIMTAHGKQR